MHMKPLHINNSAARLVKDKIQAEKQNKWAEK